MNDSLTLVPGIEVGHATDNGAITGCTVVLRRQPGGAVGAVDLVGGWNTTLAVVATNARLSRESLAVIARMAASALHRCITPVATNVDGDVVFALSTAPDDGPEADLHRLGVAARRQLERAIIRAVR